MATLSFKNVNKVYSNKFHAVHDFNLEIKDKEFIVFVGPSGCGKTTTLRMVAGFEDISSGEIWIDDTCVNTKAPKDRNIAMVFQNYALYPHMTVFENMAFALKLRKIYMPVTSIDEEDPKYKEETEAIISQFDEETNLTVRDMKASKKDKEEIKEYRFKRRASLISELEKINAKYEKPVMTFDEGLTTELEKKIKEATEAGNVDLVIKLKEDLDKAYNTLNCPAYSYRHYNSREIYEKVTDTAKILGLEPYLKRKPAALSGGQRQRVALGRAIVRKPKVFLMDEPLSNLDAKLRVQTRSEIIKIHKKVGATTIYVTHDQTEAMTMADRIVIMKDGVVQQIGSPKEVYEKPANAFVGGFIGSPSMNLIKGVYKKGVITFSNGQEYKLNEKQIKDHDKFYKEQYDFEKDNYKKFKNDLDDAKVEFFAKKHSIKDCSEYERKYKLDLACKSKLIENYEKICKGTEHDIIFGIRPEHVYLESDANIKNKSDKFTIEVDFHELLGYEMIVYGQLFGQKIIFKVSSKNDIREGDKLTCVLDNDSLHLFDKATEKAIF